MTRFLLATTLVAALGSAAVAQPVPVAPPVPPPVAPAYPAQTLPPVVVQLPLNQPPIGPGIPFHKSGGLVVGLYGLYPYDTGAWLLADTAGLTRQSGAFTMVYPDVIPAPTGKHPWFKHGWLRK